MKKEHKRALMFAHFFPPLGGGGVQRTAKFVKYLPAFGWTPSVITVRPGAYWVQDETLEEELPPNVDVTRTISPSVFYLLRYVPGGGESGRGGQRSGRLFSFLRNLSSFVLIPDQYVGWVPFAVIGALGTGRRKEISLVYSTSSPDSTHLAALAMKWILGKPWVADFRDPWTERLTFHAPTRIHLWLHRFLERRVLCTADLVVCTSNEMVDDFQKKYPRIEAKKFLVVTNGFDSDDFTGQVPLRKEFTVSHTGILTGKRNAVGFLEGLRRFLSERPDARSRMRVDFIGPRDRENEREAHQRGLSDVVIFHDTMPHRECVEFQRSSHLLLLIEDESYRGSLIYPAKVFEYAASQRPILALVPEGPVSGFVGRLKGGVVTSSSKPEEIARVIATHFATYESQVSPDAGWGRVDPRRYERHELARQLADAFDRLVAAREGSVSSLGR